MKRRERTNEGASTRWMLTLVLAALSAPLAIAACGSTSASHASTTPSGAGASGGASGSGATAAGGSSTAGGSAGGEDAGGDADAPDAPDVAHVEAGWVDVGVSTQPCMTNFRYVPPPGSLPHAVSVSGEWNGFASPGVVMSGPDATGGFSAQVQLPPGLVAYKFIVDGNWILDPAERWQKYVGGIANSAVQVVDCHLPTLALVTNDAPPRPASGQGVYTATALFVPGVGAPPLDPKTVAVTVRKDGQTSPVTGVMVDEATGSISFDLQSLADGKYSAFVAASDLAGQVASPLRLVFWIEASKFAWNDALIYMAVTDRFKNGDTTNDAPPTTAGPNGTTVTVDPREDYHGGDFAGMTAKIADGTLDQLGVNVLWLSPFYTNPSDAWPASDNVHYVIGFHGYWPTKGREVDPRWGGAAALSTLVTTAHAHGIRVLMDTVVQHVHQEHEYLKTHPEWFNTTGCICGTNNCDWTVHRLDCLFTSYLPNIDWTNPAGVAQWQADAAWWVDTFDLDGFRLDAVKQVPDIAVINLVSTMHDTFEASGNHVFMVGETAMGWVDNTLADNLSQYQLINEYIQDGLDGQFDFVLYYAVPMNVFANQSYGLDHADYWSQASGWEYPGGSIMSPFIGSEDTARFISIASYRGQTPALDPSIPYNQWTNVAGPPPDSETYGRHRGALAWLLGQPGAPLVYYGDEYGQYGGVDPNNRMDWRGDSASLSADEQATLAYARKLGQARKNLVAMRRGAYVPVYAEADVLVFARQDAAGDVALEALSRLDVPTSVTAALPPALGIADGTVLHDRMGGPDVTVTGGVITVSLGAQSAAFLGP
jgi:glycosidase